MSDTVHSPPGATNVDAAELEKFQSIAANWWDPESEFAPLHRINPLRLAWIEGIAPLAGQRVLDVGCGGGILTEAMASRGAQVTGIDLAQASLQVAELHKLESGVAVDYRCIAVEALAEEAPARFDTVTCMEMLEHVPDPASVVRACATLVKLLAPFAPFIAEEIWRGWGNTASVHIQPWPAWDPALAQVEEVEMAVQVNGKVRDRICIAAGTAEEVIRQSALAAPGVRRALEGRTVRHIVIVPGRVVNIVT